MTNAQNRKRWAIDQQKKARAAWVKRTMDTWDTVQFEALKRMYFNIQLSAMMRGIPFVRS